MPISFKLPNGVEVKADTASEAQQLLHALSLQAPPPGRNVPGEPTTGRIFQRRVAQLTVHIVADYINARNKTVDISHIADHFNTTRHNASAALSRCISAGLIQRVGNGKYAPLPPGHPAQLQLIKPKSQLHNYNTPSTRETMRVILELFTRNGSATIGEVAKQLGMKKTSVKFRIWKCQKLGWLKSQSGQMLYPTETALAIQVT